MLALAGQFIYGGTLAFTAQGHMGSGMVVMEEPAAEGQLLMNLNHSEPGVALKGIPGPKRAEVSLLAPPDDLSGHAFLYLARRALGVFLGG